MLGLPHPRGPAPDPALERTARYARGRDYHHVFRSLLRRLARRLRADLPDLALRPFCDVHPVMDKALAVRAGLGFQGRNTLVIHPTHGSDFTVGGLLVDLPLPPSPRVPFGCGDCRRCLDACPTGALLEPGILDVDRCLARWTTNGRDPPPDLPRGPYDFGCDVCRDACPFNGG